MRATYGKWYLLFIVLCALDDKSQIDVQNENQLKRWQQEQQADIPSTRNSNTHT